ncbi:hypothetical protein LNTAR_13287 [Lentisphaera araneosa HTCC2155]|uniref:Methylamine utilisation protein MauE domain-containing protein n=1 Tax=Lentisphaera araneosa HTCC2155 TaxID=313628 RepID=A6DRQ6_9BACT|nr:MauE/DoxX family redox-associated membrane protein [Lentisphaera araneosa]EDM25725.1 hypothetical protein LNTAR_13287 [Lentisphaera araneosa HTCC2155]
MRYEIIPRTLLISVFAFSAITKLSDIESVYLLIDEVMPFIKINALIEIVSFYVPILELTLCLSLCFKATQRLSYTLSLILSISFLSFILYLGPSTNCACFGSLLKLTHAQSIILDTTLISLSFLGFYLSKKDPAKL